MSEDPTGIAALLSTLWDKLWWVVALVLTNIASYLVGRKGKTDAIRIQRAHEVNEAVSTAFQDFRSLEKSLASWYGENFSHIPSVNKAMEYFQKYAKGLYAPQWEQVEQLEAARVGLGNALRDATPYLNAKLLAELREYLDLSRFTFIDSTIFSTYAEELFTNLTDDTKSAARDRLAKRILARLRKAP